MISIISTTYDSATLVIVSYTAVSDLQASLKKKLITLPVLSKSNDNLQVYKCCERRINCGIFVWK